VVVISAIPERDSEKQSQVLGMGVRAVGRARVAWTTWAGGVALVAAIGLTGCAADGSLDGDTGRRGAAVPVWTPAPGSAASSLSPVAGTTGTTSPTGTPSASAAPPPKGVSAISDGRWEAVDLPTVLKLAGERAVVIDIARRAVDEAQANSSLAASRFLGRLQAGPSFYQHSGRLQDIAGNLITADKTNFRPAARVGIDINPVRAGFETLAARQLTEAGRSAVERAGNDAALAAAEGFLDLALAVERHRTAAAALDRATELVRITQRGLDGGVRTPADLARAQALAARQELAVQQADAAVQTASVRLATTLRLPPDVTLYPADPSAARQRIDLIPPDAPIKSLVETALASHPELSERDRTVRALENYREAAKWEALAPKVGAEVYGGGLGKNVAGLQPFEDFSVFVGWELEGLGFGNAARERAARARLGREQALREGTRDRIAADAVEAAVAVKLRLRQLDTVRRQFEAAEAGYREIAKRTEAGLGLQLDVLTALADLTDAETRLVEAAVEYNKAQYRLLHRLGRKP
jgi:OMF family outer membrane factor